MNFFEFIFIYTLLLISIIGYGLLFSNKFTSFNNFEKNNISIGLIGILGIFFSIFISYLTIFFTPHNNSHNIIFILFGIIFFIYFYFKKKKYFFKVFFLFIYSIFFLYFLF